MLIYHNFISLGSQQQPPPDNGEAARVWACLEFLAFVQEGFEFVHELCDVFKLAVDGGETHIGHFV